MLHFNEHSHANVKKRVVGCRAGVGEEKRMDIVDDSCRRKEEGDQSKGCLCVASQPSLECVRVDSRGESVYTGNSSEANWAEGFSRVE